MIRKIVIGSDYKNAMAYKLGQEVAYDENHGGSMVITSFIDDEDTGMVSIYVTNEIDETEVWKDIPTDFVIKEYDIFK